MSVPRCINLTPKEASCFIERELRAARDGLRSAQIDLARDKFASALGLALQLGPAAIDRVLLYVMDTIHDLTFSSDSEALSTIGPALVRVVYQVRDAGALPPTRVMEAWATVASDLGVIVGQVGLALSIESERRSDLIANALARAAALDDATGSRFATTDWVYQVSGRSQP